MNPIRNIIIEGVDRLGKDTLIQGIQHRLGFFQKMHYQKPELLQLYQKEAETYAHGEAEIKKAALKKYQVTSFTTMFQMLAGKGRFLMNRAHLGEVVYSPRYRGYAGDYVFELEQNAPSAARDETLLILLHTSDFSFIKDDGLSFDFEKKEEEQNDFCRAFDRSNLKYKQMIDVSVNGGFVPADMILNTVIAAYKTFLTMPHPVWNVNWTTDSSGTIFTAHDHLQPDPKSSMS